MAEHPTRAEQMQARVQRLARIAHERGWPEEQAEEPGQMELEPEGDEE